MNTVIMYDSTFGNTEQLARVMADTLRAHSTVRIARVAEADPLDLKEAELLLMGGPTQRHRLSPALRAFLDRLPRRSLPGLSAAAFDTRYHMDALRITSREIVPTVRISPRFLRASEVPILVPRCFRQLFGQQERITLRRWTGTISREADLFEDGGRCCIPGRGR